MLFALSILRCANPYAAVRAPLTDLTAAVLIVCLGAATLITRAPLRTMRHRALDVYKIAALIVLNVIVCFIVLEAAAAGLVTARTAFAASDDGIDSRSHSSYYTTQPWAPLYWREFRDSRRQMYQPFVLWNRRPFTGKTINVDADGVRLTPGAACGARAFTVFVIGGSTVWGTGSPDWGTLPAYIQTELQLASDRPVCVVNLGESAYVSTQSLLRLLFYVRAGHTPDLVVLYEGPNDVYSAYQTGRAAVHENLDEFVSAFERPQIRTVDEIAGALRRTNLYWIISAIIAKATHAEDREVPLATYRTKGVDEQALAASIADTYLANYGVVDALARRYGFAFRSFWPPYIATGRKPLTPEERALLDAVDPDFLRLYRTTRHAVVAQHARYPNLIDIGSTFDGYTGLLWVDDMHVTPVGNQLLAHRIVTELHQNALTGKTAE